MKEVEKMRDNGTNNRKPLIWLFREEEPEDRYRAVFESNGFDTRHIPVLQFRFESKWEPVPSVDALVVTSRRAAESLASNEDLDHLLPRDWRRIPWYAIGPSTTKALYDLGVDLVEHAAQTSTDLANVIIGDNRQRIAFLAGEPHRVELPRILRDAGVDVMIRIVYRSVPALGEPLAENEHPDWAAFFSPRGVEIVADSDGPDWQKVNVVAIGPTTAEAVRDCGWNLVASAARAEAGALFQAVQGVASSVDSNLFKP